MKLKSVLITACVLFTIPFTAVAQSTSDYPNKPIRLVVPFNPGGPTDLMGRYVAEKISQQLRQPVIVENRSGANGIVGSTSVMKSTNDGYTLLFVTVGTHAINPSLYKNVPYKPLNDFDFVALTGSTPNVLLAHPSLKIKTLAELLAFAKANPGKVSYASGGNGATSHLAAELLRTMASLEMQHIPYQGNAAALVDIISGRVPLGFQAPSTSIPLINNGTVYALGVTSDTRIAAMPNVPAISEAGLPGYSVLLWYGVVAPKGTPKAIVDRLNKAINDGLSTAASAEHLAKWDVVFKAQTSDAFKAYVGEELRKWEKVVKASGAQVD